MLEEKWDKIYYLRFKLQINVNQPPPPLYQHMYINKNFDIIRHMPIKLLNFLKKVLIGYEPKTFGCNLQT